MKNNGTSINYVKIECEKRGLWVRIPFFALIQKNLFKDFFLFIVKFIIKNYVTRHLEKEIGSQVQYLEPN